MREIKEQKINTKRCRKRIFRNSYEKQRKVVSRFCDQNKTASTLCWNFWCIFIFFVRISLSNSSISSALYGRVEIVNATYVVLTCSMIVLKDHFCLIATLFWVMIRNYCVAFFLLTKWVQSTFGLNSWDKKKSIWNWHWLNKMNISVF